MSKLRYVLAASAGLALSGCLPASAQDDQLAKVEIKATKVAGNVWILEGAGGNIGVSAGPDGILVIDDQFEPLAEKIRAALKGISPAKLSFLINTHHHGDHTGGNAVFGKELTIIAQDNVRKRLTGGQRPMAPSGLPVITYADGVSVWFNGEEIRVFHAPHGHTDGDSIVWFKSSNVIHMGDQLFNGFFPFIDLDSGGSLAGYTKNLEDVLAQVPKGVKVIPGHGALATVAEIEKAHTMLVETAAIVAKEKASGTSLEDAKKAGLPDTWKSWATDFMPVERWVEFLYRAN
ncbi:MAG TPA: MBL fold metallo-hydrolase [Candidatus Polarisedimenticolaceae bacterium]|nr:MBL fold metallo-hydrolase [Candidatus Polarisedimenticolaceae bacterium]